MQRPKRNSSRRQIKKRRRLRDQRDRQADRESKQYKREVFSWGSFLKKNRLGIFFLFVALIMVMVIMTLGPDKGAIKKMSDSVSSILVDQSETWREAYPYGYKIIALTDREIIHTSFNTLPEALVINWENLSVARVRANQLKGADEKIKIEIPDINYAPANISGNTVTAAFTRRKGVVASLAILGDMEFVVQVVEDDGQRTFCLFGLRPR